MTRKFAFKICCPIFLFNLIFIATVACGSSNEPAAPQPPAVEKEAAVATATPLPEAVPTEETASESSTTNQETSTDQETSAQTTTETEPSEATPETSTEISAPAPAAQSTPLPPAELRGVWISEEDILNPEKIKEILDRVETGGFNTLFVSVFAFGEGYYNSALLQKTSALDDPNFDPLAALIQEAHPRNMEVHAWYAIGPVGAYDGSPGPILTEHPEWGTVGIDGGRGSYWLNFTRPDVREFVGDIMLEVIENYDIQGIHLDYIRYPNRTLGFDNYSAQTFKEQSGIDLETLRYATLPAFGFFEGYSLSNPTTAQTIAYLDDIGPAVLLNQYGQGQVILLNWNAGRRDIVASTEIFKRSLDLLQSDNGRPIYLLESKTNKDEFGGSDFRNVRDWLRDLGYIFNIIEEDEIANLDLASVLVMPNIYVMTDEVAANLATYVEQGGHMIFVDGPIYAIDNENIQAITGMSQAGEEFEDETLLLASGQHPLIPNNPNASLDFDEYEALDDTWQQFRKEGINQLVSEVYQRIKNSDPNVKFSAAVFPNYYSASRVLQDWYTWVENENIDFVIPMSYDADITELALDVAEWKFEVPGGFERVIPGLAVADFNQSDEPLKPTANILKEISTVKSEGAKGVVIFSIDYANDEILNALHQGPFN